MAKFNLEDAIDTVGGAIGDAQSFLNSKNNPLSSDQRNQFKSDGFLLPPTYSADGTGLPFSKVPSGRQGQLKRNIITWFVPEFGLVRMYVNPNSINYKHTKLINKDKTKGGFTVQYWGEDLTTLTINGTTGSSGIEGINMLYEIYRAEQFAFDSVGLSLDANNAAADVANNLINGFGGAVGKEVGGLFGADSDISAASGAGLLGGILGLDSPNNSLANKNIPSLAQLAFSVEMHYNGIVYRGYFTDMNIQERADNFLFDYTMNFTVTQTRGYRTNYFPFHKSAKDGPSSYSTENSFSSSIAGVVEPFNVSTLTGFSKKSQF